MIYILLPVHNRKSITEKFIHSLIKQTKKDFKLILIDDGSKDGTADMVRQYIPESVVIQGNGKLWWAGGVQKGYVWLKENSTEEDHCLIINDDTVFDANFIEEGVRRLVNTEKTLFLASCYSQQTNLLLDCGVEADFEKLTFKPAKNRNSINCMSTRGLFLKVKDFKTIGGFYPKLLPHYLSDYEFTIRAHRKGYRLLSDNYLKLYVDETTTGTHKISSIGFFDYLIKYFSYRNPSNPRHWIPFLVLACPPRWKIRNLALIVARAIKGIFFSQNWKK